MANIKFNKGLLANLPAQSTEGALYFTTDESIYLGLANGQYHRFGDFIEVANVASLPEDGAHAKALYYCTEENVLAKWDGSAWKQINLNTTYKIETGATAGAVKLVGSNGTSVEVQVVDVAGLESSIAEAKGQADKGVADAKTADDKAVAAQEAVDALASKVGTVAEDTTVMAEIADNTSQIADLRAIVQAMTGDEEGSVGSISKAIDSKIEALDLPNTYEPIGKGAEEAGKVQDALDEYIESNDVAVADAKKAGTDAQTYAEGVNTALETYKGTNDVAVKEAKDAADEAKATADAKVASVTAGDASVTVAGTSTEPTVAVKVSADADNAIDLVADGLKVVIPDAPEYSVVKDENSGEYAAVYHLTKDGVNVGASINIPKDLVVKSGSVVDGDIVLVLNDEANTEIVIPADSLIEYVTSGSVAGDMVVINVDESTHKVTATITDGTIGLAKLTTEVQTAIGKAHSHENADVLAGITADKVSAWDASEQNAKDYADGLDEAMGIRVKAIEDDYLKEADIANKADKATTLAGYGITDAYTKDEVNASIKAVDDKFAGYTNTEGMNSAIGTAKSEAVAEATALNTAMDTRVKALEEIDHDAYVDADATNLQTAKDYADSAVETAMTWGEF